MNRIFKILAVLSIAISLLNTSCSHKENKPELTSPTDTDSSNAIETTKEINPYLLPRIRVNGEDTGKEPKDRIEELTGRKTKSVGHLIPRESLN